MIGIFSFRMDFEYIKFSATYIGEKKMSRKINNDIGSKSRKKRQKKKTAEIYHIA